MAIRESWSRWGAGVLLSLWAVAAGSAQGGGPPLPPVGSPLAETIDDLTWGMARGEPEAACRLAMAMGACAVDLPESRHRGIYDYFGTADPDERREWYERLYERADRYEERLEAQCAGAPRLSSQVLLSVFRRAALLGSVEAMRTYVEANYWLSDEWHEAGPERAAWRAHALPVAWALLRAGDLNIARDLWGEYVWRDDEATKSARAGSPEGRFEVMDGLQEDVVKGAALVRYALAVREAAIPEPHSDELFTRRQIAQWFDMFDEELTPDEQAQAQALVAEWLADFNRLPERKPAHVPPNQDAVLWYRGKFSLARMAACDHVAPALD